MGQIKGLFSTFDHTCKTESVVNYSLGLSKDRKHLQRFTKYLQVNFVTSSGSVTSMLGLYKETSVVGNKTKADNLSKSFLQELSDKTPKILL